MTEILQMTDIQASPQFVYSQLLQLERLPEFMEGLKEIRPSDRRHFHWKSENDQGDGEIIQEIPYSRIKWKSTGTEIHHGAVFVQAMSGCRCRLSLSIHHEGKEPLPLLETGTQVRSALERFRKRTESLAHPNKKVPASEP